MIKPRANFEKPYEEYLCHCLEVTHAQVEDLSKAGLCQSLDEVRQITAAGSGCTACHRRIIAMLQQNQSASSSPICAAR